jgi:plastocyanin
VTACGGDDGGATIDAGTIDSAGATIARVDPCPGTVDATVITTGANMYMPAATTISQGQVVKFTMNGAHDVAATMGTNAILAVPLGGERCFRFTAPGTFTFKCNPHGFTGMITVN